MGVYHLRGLTALEAPLSMYYDLIFQDLWDPDKGNSAPTITQSLILDKTKKAYRDINLVLIV